MLPRIPAKLALMTSAHHAPCADYTLHKLLQGLLDVHLVLGAMEPLQMALRVAGCIQSAAAGASTLLPLSDAGPSLLLNASVLCS